MRTPDFDVDFWTRIWRAVQRLLGAAVLLAAHAAFDRLIPFVVHRYPMVEYWSSVGLNVAFLAIYSLLLIEMIEVLIWWRRR